MTKRKNTKSALLSSVVALFLCFAMLLGTTFAWFTDSVVSGSNVIQTGTLDIVLEYWDGSNWIDAEGKVIPFVAADGRSEILWEPGCTYEMAPIRVRNEGSLAAKLLIILNGIKGDETLMEVIELKTKINNIPDSVLNGSAGNQLRPFEDAEVGILYGMPEGNIIFDWSLAGKGTTTPGTGHTDTSPEFTIFGHMSEEAGNKYQDLSIEGITISVIATQQTYESDSFGNNYDKDADYVAYDFVADSAEELTTALSEGGNIILDEDITLNTAINVTEDTYINLNGKTLTVFGLNFLSATTVIENGTIASAGHTDMIPHLNVEGGSLEMTGVTVEANHHLLNGWGYSEAAGIGIVNASAVLNNCDIKVNNQTQAKWVFSYAISLTDADVVVNGGSITAKCIDGTSANGPTNPNGVSAMGNCNATLNNVTVSATYYGTTVRGHLTLNTTDRSITSANIVDNNGGSHTLNYID